MPNVDWSQFGLAGILIGLLSFFAFTLIRFAQWLLCRQIERHEKDRQESLQALADKRHEFLEAIKGLEASFSLALDKQQAAFGDLTERIEAQWQRTADALCDRLEKLEAKVDERGGRR